MLFFRKEKVLLLLKIMQTERATPRDRLFIREDQRFANQSALVTGVSKPEGIGAAIARGLAYFGARGILMTATSGSRKLGEALVREVEGEGTHGVWIGANLATPRGVEKIIEEMVARKDEFGRAYPLLLLNAGVVLDERLENLTYRNLHHTLAVNLEAPMMLVSRALKEGLLPKGYGRVVINGSFVAYGNKGGQEAYGASKAALAGFIANAAQDEGEHGITINGVFPGFIATEMTMKATEDAPMYREAYTVGAAVGRLGLPEDVAFHMLHFADPRSGFATGQALILDGGIGNPAVIRRMLENGYVRLNPQERRMVMMSRRQTRQTQANPSSAEENK